MADETSLLSILAGNDPLSPKILDALHAEQARGMVSNPANWQNQGIWGGLARTLAGFAAPSGGPQVADITAQRNAARPEMAQLLAGDDPYKAAAANPNVNPINLATLLSGATPGSIAEARIRAAQAAKEGLNLRGYQSLPAQTGLVPSGKNAGAVMGGGTPMTGGDTSVLGTGRPDPTGGNATQGALDLPSLAAMAPAQQAAALKNMNPQQKAAMAAQLARLRAQRSASAPGNVAPPI